MASPLRDERPALGLLLGDPAGIGPEISARLLHRHSPERMRLVVIGSRSCLERGFDQAGLPCPDVPAMDGEPEAAADAAFALQPLSSPWDALPPVGQISRDAGRYCLQALRGAVDLVGQGRLAGFAYGPMNKASLHRNRPEVIDDIGLLSDLFGLETPGSEINLLHQLCTARVTSHIPLAQVPARITVDAVAAAIRRLHGTMEALAFPNRAIAVAGLNPHASDDGLFGDEEAEVLAPAIAWAQSAGMAVSGPFPPDTVFVRAQRGEFGGVVTMYHDQGQIAMKLMGFAKGVTLASGLPAPVATTAHGTAFDIAGAGTADPASLANALDACLFQALTKEETLYAA